MEQNSNIQNGEQGAGVPVQPQQQYAPQPQQQYAPQAIENPGKGMGIASMVLGIVALVFCFIPFLGWLGVILGIVGLVLGFVSLKKTPQGVKSGMAKAGIVTSIIAIALNLIMLIVVAGFIGALGTAASASGY
ncbi:MAG: DUF4190 domain-containing protein [Coriobacteriia bacterium]|nr:DUF4190 domain-containing protein [Coriobacteriia bacterium]MCL2537323.1 DUF4190 domain-containing protein [Coriobacteriia bacterium]